MDRTQKKQFGKWISGCLAAIFVFALCPTVQIAAADIVPNGGFEAADISAWTTLPNGDCSAITRETTGGKTGDGFLAFTSPGADTVLACRLPFVQRTVYHISLWARVGEGTASVRFTVQRPQGTPAVEYVTFGQSLTTEWKKLTFDYQCAADGEGSNPGYLALYLGTAGTRLEIDDFTAASINSGYSAAYQLPYASFADVRGTANQTVIDKMVFDGVMRPASADAFAPAEDADRAALLYGAVQASRTTTVSYAGAFADVNSAHWYAKAAQTAKNRGWIDSAMVSGTQLLPEKAVTRQETASVLARAYRVYDADKTCTGALSGCSDAGDVAAWAQKDVELAVGLGILPLQKGRFNPNQTLSREQLAVCLSAFRGAVNAARMSSAFVSWVNSTITLYRANGMTAEADALTADLAAWDGVAANPQDYTVQPKIKSFYTNPFSRELIRYAERLVPKSAAQTKVGTAAVNSLPTYTDPFRVAGQTNVLLWAFLDEYSPFAGNEYILTQILSDLERTTYLAVEGNAQHYYNNKDSNYNLFYYSQYNIAYLKLKTMYPCFVLPSMQRRWEQHITEGITYQEHNNPTIGTGHYANVDMLLLNMYAAAGRILDNPAYMERAEDILAKNKARLLPDGGAPYIGNENEIVHYHNAILRDVARYQLLTGSEAAADYIRATANYYPLTLDNNGAAEYGTALIWKQNWASGGKLMGPVIAAHYAQDGRNQAIAQEQIANNPTLISMNNEDFIIAAACWDDTIEPEPWNGDGIQADANIGGFRGRFGGFSYFADTRSRTIPADYTPDLGADNAFSRGTHPGKPTYVGAMLSEEHGLNPISGAVSKVYSAVRTAWTGNELADQAAFSNHSTEYLLMEETMAAMSAGYQLGNYGASKMKWTAADAQGNELWYFDGSRMIGYVEAEAAGRVYGQAGKIQLFGGNSDSYQYTAEKQPEQQPDGSYLFGGLRITVHDTNYQSSRVDTDVPVINANIHKSGGARASELVLYDTQYGTAYPGGRRYFVVEIAPQEAEPTQPEISQLSPEVAAVHIAEDVVLLYNHSANAVTLKAAEPTILTVAGAAGTATVRRLSAGDTLSLSPYGFARLQSGSCQVVEKEQQAKTVLHRTFDGAEWTAQERGYYTDPAAPSRDNVLFYDSKCDTRPVPSPHFETAREGADGFVRMKVPALPPETEGEVKPFYLQLSNLYRQAGKGSFDLPDGTGTYRLMSLECSLRYDAVSGDAFKWEVFAANEAQSAAGGSFSVTFPNAPGTGRGNTGQWNRVKLLIDRTAGKVYATVNDMPYTTVTPTAATVENLFRFGVYQMRMHYMGTGTGNTFAKDNTARSVCVDDIRVGIPAVGVASIACYGQDGTPANTLEQAGGALTVFAVLMNNTPVSRTASAVAGVYQNGVLVECVVSAPQQLPPMSYGAEVRMPLSMPEELEGSEVRLFLWDSPETMRPLDDVHRLFSD